MSPSHLSLQIVRRPSARLIQVQGPQGQEQLAMGYDNAGPAWVQWLFAMKGAT